MAGTRKLEIIIAGDAKGATSAFNETHDGLSKLGDGIKKFAKVAAVGIVAAGAGLAVFAKSAISAASDLNETISKSNTIFGENAKAIDDWSKTAASKIGQSRKEALDAAATFGNLFVQLGVGTKKAAGLSTSMVELASDFASFHNAAPADVIEAMTAAFRGEYDAVQRYVPTINAAAVEQKALEMTGKKLAKSLTLQEKALATQALLYEGAGAAMGDFARTSDGLANRQRILKARFADIQAEIGTKLLPVVVTVAGFILDTVIPAIEKWADWLGVKLPPIFAEVKRIAIDVFEQRLIPAFQAVSDVIMTKFWPAIQTTFNFLMDHKEILVATAIVIGTSLVSAFIAWAVAAGAAAIATIAAIAPVVAVNAAIIALVAGIIYAYEHWGWFHDAVDKAWQILQKVAHWFIDSFFPTLAEVTVKIWNFGIDVKDAIVKLYNFFVDTGEKLYNAIKDPFERAFEWVKWTYDHSIGPIIQAIRDFSFGPANGGFGGGLSAGDVKPPGRALGGPVMAGAAYTVGERGPELFVPGRSGSIVPNGAGMTIIVQGSVLSERDLIGKIQDAVRRGYGG